MVFMRSEIGIQQDGPANLHGIMNVITLAIKRSAVLIINGCCEVETAACRALDVAR